MSFHLEIECHFLGGGIAAWESIAILSNDGIISMAKDIGLVYYMQQENKI